MEELAANSIQLNENPLSIRRMPQEVSMRWNSTYNMLKFAYTYREAIDKITGDHSMKLRDYELLESKWEDSLKVHVRC